MEEQTCQSCKHFRQHYIKMGWRYSFVNCGHCVYPRLKHRQSITPACAKYAAREQSSEA